MVFEVLIHTPTAGWEPSKSVSLVIIYRLFRKVAENKRIRWFSKLIFIGGGA